jgi:nitroreductase
MDVYEAIEKRFSVRSYEDRPVDADPLERILTAGRMAPSARNLQDMKIVVVRDAAIRSALAAAAEQPFIAQAPVVLAVVCLDPDRKMFCGVPNGPVDCAIVIDHMTLAATAEGLGTCWIGHFDQTKCREILHVPASAQIIELLPIGYPAVEAGEKKRRPLDELICQDRFS